MQIKIRDGNIKCLKIVNSFLLNDSRKISLKWRHLPQCILDVKTEIGEKEIPFGFHKQMTGEGMSAVLHYYFPYCELNYVLISLWVNKRETKKCTCSYKWNIFMEPKEVWLIWIGFKSFAFLND